MNIKEILSLLRQPAFWLVTVFWLLYISALVLGVVIIGHFVIKFW